MFNLEKKSKMNNKGQFGIIVQLLILFLAVTFLIALIPGFSGLIDSGLSYQSGLNCAGAIDYNSTLGERSTIGCLGLKLYIPYIVLGVLVVLVARLFMGRTPQPFEGGYQG